MPTAFEILGLPATASGDDVNTAYRRLAKKHHPDRPEGSTGRMRQLNVARDKALAFIKQQTALRKVQTEIAATLHSFRDYFDSTTKKPEPKKEAPPEQREWVLANMNSRYPYPQPKGWFDLSTKPGIELALHIDGDEAAFKVMQERLALLHKLVRRERARASRARRR